MLSSHLYIFPFFNFQTTKDHSVEENRTEVDIVITSQQIAMRTIILTLQPATKVIFIIFLFIYGTNW